MARFFALFRKELGGFFATGTGWTVVALVTALNGLALSSAMTALKEKAASDNLVYLAFHSRLFWFTFLALFPLLTMRLFAEEEKNGTLETLLTAPIHTWHVVCAKFSAALICYLVAWLPALCQFFFFEWFAGIPRAFEWPVLATTFAFLACCGSSFIALGLLCSALSSNSIVAAFLGLATLIILHFVGYIPVIWGENFAGIEIIRAVSAQLHLHRFASGLIDSQTLIYYLSLTTTVLYLTSWTVDLRRSKA